MQCVITGCALIDGNRWLAGDLFDAGAVFVFNGNYDHETRAPCWQGGNPFHAKQIDPSAWWEKRGVYVIPKDEARLNAAALEYIK